MKEFVISEVKAETAILVGLVTKEQDEAKTKRKDRKRGIHFFIIGPRSQRAGEEGLRTCSSPPLPLCLPKQLEFQA